ncbi:probable ribosome production factor 1 [Panulirus ornatus]|uniref:probable ribosome production factor 1 n=1 Tax=Panulirus ornatus TaxID=150431 RepID=UPI003A8883BA
MVKMENTTGVEEIEVEETETETLTDDNMKMENTNEVEEIRVRKRRKKTLMPSRSSINEIRNKFIRNKAFRNQKHEIRKLRAEESKAKKKGVKVENDTPRKKPHTIESLREKDETMLYEGDEELEQEEATDTYASYFNKSYVPKILVTCSDNPHSKTIAFVRELCRLIPEAEASWRKRTSIKKLIKGATENGFTDVLVVNEDKRVPNGLLVVHLPEGPTALFRLSNPKICKEVHRNFREITPHRPEIILNNFRTRLGRVVARMLGALFHYDPEFKGRRVCTFHNQRDYIFFRHHRYEFKNTQKVRLRELGPRFTLRLEWLQQGAFEGDYEWALKRHDMETSRRRFFL